MGCYRYCLHHGVANVGEKHRETSDPYMPHVEREVGEVKQEFYREVPRDTMRYLEWMEQEIDRVKDEPEVEEA